MTLIPVLRWGEPYESLEQEDIQTLHPVSTNAKICRANTGLIGRDLKEAGMAWMDLQKIPVAQLLEITRTAGELFSSANLPLGNSYQSPEDYIRQLSSTTGLPLALCRKNIEKIHLVCAQMGDIFHSLTRGLNLEILDSGYGFDGNILLSYKTLAQSLGVLLPSNSPGVNTLWLPAIPLKTPVILKPAREDPWTPYRLIQAFIQAGVPSNAFCYYPTDHEGATKILDNCDRSLLFGGGKTTSPWEKNAVIQIHGQGRSKIVIGPDRIDHWRDYVEVCLTSILENGGRMCINASTIVVPRHADELADVLAKHLGPLSPIDLDDPEANLAAFTDPAYAEKINSFIENSLNVFNAEDVTARYRNGARMARFKDGTYIRPTIIRCRDWVDPLANTEVPLPFSAIIESPVEELVSKLGQSLVVTAITEDQDLISTLITSPNIDRLNIGEIPTTQISRDQPHEGNLFEFLYQRRALEMTDARRDMPYGYSALYIDEKVD